MLLKHIETCVVRGLTSELRLQHFRLILNLSNFLIFKLILVRILILIAAIINSVFGRCIGITGTCCQNILFNWFEFKRTMLLLTKFRGILELNIFNLLLYLLAVSYEIVKPLRFYSKLKVQVTNYSVLGLLIQIIILLYLLQAL